MSEQIWKKKVDLFRSRFFSRDDYFNIRDPYTIKVVNKETGQEELKDGAFMMPSCANYGDHKVCQITKRTGRCSDCDHKEYRKLTDEVIWDHLSGKQEIALYMLRQEGVRFGAIDFDKGTVFEDAKAARDLSVSCGLPCYIARSTKKGYHLYWFFSDFIQAHEFTSFTRYLYEELGFYDRARLNPEIGIPENFPKQTVCVEGKLGNCIKVPMMEPRMREGRNCWVDDEAVPIPIEKQWEFLEKTQYVTPEAFKKVLEEKNIEILKAPASRDRARARQEEGRDPGTTVSTIKPFGNFWNVIEGCPALREYWAKDESGKYIWDHNNPKGLFHRARYASMVVAMSTTNGEEEIIKRWPDKGRYHIEHAKSQGYSPVTCRWMQENSVCHVGRHPKCNDHCIKRIPPVIYEEGKRKVNPDNLPEDQWPDPSPIRFATDRNLSADDIIDRLTLLFRGSKAKTDEDKAKAAEYMPANPEERIMGLLDRGLSLEEDDWAKVKNHILANKYMTKKDLETKEKSILKKRKKDQETKKEASDRAHHKSFKFGNDEFFDKEGIGYFRVWHDIKGNRCEEQLTNFTVLIHEEQVVIRIKDSEDLIDQQIAEDRTIKGTLVVDSQKLTIDVPYLEWIVSPETFFRTLSRIGGGALIYRRANFDHIRNCINEFSKERRVTRKVSRQIGYHRLKGRDVYITPSVLVDKDAVRVNEEFVVEPFKDDASRCLDFKALSEEEFKALGRHIVDEYFSCNNAVLTMTTFAHAMAAAIIPQIAEAVGYKKAPVLWLAGSQSGGKTFVAEAAQNFYGDFDVVQNATGSAKSKLHAGFNFRHAFMLVDDYKKNLVDPFQKEFPLFVQNAYDRSGRTALHRNGKAREQIDRVRGLICITGEDVIESEASSLSRSIMVDVTFKENRVSGGQVKIHKSNYCGFTPYFIQYVLNVPLDYLEDMWDHYYKFFYEPVKETHAKASPGRVCENLTLNMVAFKLAMEMLVARGSIADVMSDEFCRIHEQNLITIRSTVFETVMQATGAKIFLEALKELVQNPTQCIVHNWPGYAAAYEVSGSCRMIGFYKENTPDTIYIYPQIAHGMVADLVRKNNKHVQSLPHVARQLYEEGFMVSEKINREKNEFIVHARGPAKNSVRVWPIKASALGLEIESSGSKQKSPRKNDDEQPILTVVSSD